MRFPDICLVGQTEQKVHGIRDCIKEKQRRKKLVTAVIVGNVVTCNSRAS